MTNESPETELPPLIDLPVYRDTYLSQERTDELCRLLWAQRPDLIRALVEREEVVPQDRTMFARVTKRIIHFFREEEKDGRIEPITMTGMVDLIYEVDRRVRHTLGLPAIPVRWRPIAPGPLGPFPPLPDKPIRLYGEKPKAGMTQEKADRLTQELYRRLIDEMPEVIFSLVENERRHLRSGEGSWMTFNISRKCVPPGSGVSPNDVEQELMERLRLIYKMEEIEREND